jgi:primosomal replication protein N
MTLGFLKSPVMLGGKVFKSFNRNVIQSSSFVVEGFVPGSRLVINTVYI